MEKGISFKLFAGFLVNSELKMHIKSSSNWKEHEFLEKKNPRKLQIVPFEKRDYIGNYIEPAQISIKEIDLLEEQIKKSLEQLFPKCNLENLSLYFFTQAFIQ